MDERGDLSTIREADVERSTEDIRQDIAQGKENISQIVEHIEERIKEKLDWRRYVKDYPYLALGAAAGLGYLASGMFRKRTTAATDCRPLRRRGKERGQGKKATPHQYILK